MKESVIQAELRKESKHTLYYLAIVVILIGLFLWSTSVIQIRPLSAEGVKIAKNIFKGIFHPNLTFLFDLSSAGVPYLLLETIAIAILGTLVGSIIAVPLSFLSATNIVPTPIALVVRFFIMVVRTVPPFVYGLMFIRVTGPGASAGVLTLGLVSIGMVSKMFIETIEDLDPGIIESMDAAGSTFFQKIRFGIIPQLKADFFSILLYRFDMNLRDATILGLVGAGGIGAPLIFGMNAYKWSDVGSLLIGLFVLIFVVEEISSKIRNRLL
ncbi:MAG: phosphonate ABC transporter, permease protein PhnE [Lactobacillales bacterium]|jgi:phosphonate transport system permease protein|nr:phosphonate ABC transporter, permease protein PhnE [Lactobacillales bacterium]